MALETDASRMLVWRAGYLKDTGKPNTTETSIAKLYATEAAVKCANTAIQVHGGLGLRRRLSGRALPPRRARDDAVRGDLADPEADHRARPDRDQRARSCVSPPAPTAGETRIPGAAGTIGVAGAGTMGAGIAQLACLSGARTLVHDPDPSGARPRPGAGSGDTSSAASSAAA